MTINIQKFNEVAPYAKAKTNDPKWIRAIDRAAKDILSGELIVTVLAHSAIVTSANSAYRANDTCQCKAFQSGHKECKHRAATRLIELYETEPEAVSGDKIATKGATMAAFIAEIKNVWIARYPTVSLANELMPRFRIQAVMCGEKTASDGNFARRFTSKMARGPKCGNGHMWRRWPRRCFRI